MGCGLIFSFRTALIYGSKGVAKHLFFEMRTAASNAPEIAGFVEKAKSIMVFALGYSISRDVHL